MEKPNLTTLRNIDFARMVEDFRNLDPKDVGTWPIIPRITMLLGLFAAIMASGWWFDWRDQLTDLEAKEQREVKLKEEYLSKKKQAINLDEHRKQLAEIDRAFGALLKQLPNRSEMEALLIDINQAGLGRGLQFDLFRPGGEAVKDFYAELPISVRVTGTYHDLGSFSGDIAKLSRIVALTNMSFETVKDQQLKMDAIAMTYRYLDEEEVAKQRKEKADKAKGARK